MWCKGKNYSHIQAPIEKPARGFLPHEPESLAPKTVFYYMRKKAGSTIATPQTTCTGSNTSYRIPLHYLERSSEISVEDKEHIRKFLYLLKALRVNKVRITKLYHLKTIRENLKYPSRGLTVRISSIFVAH